MSPITARPRFPAGIRALVVDDSPPFRAAASRMLARMGVAVVATAADGQEAIEQFTRHQPDLVIVDVEMPRMSGLVAAAELRRRSSTLKILMVSVHDGPQVEAGCGRAGADAFVCKVGIQRRLRSAIAALFPAPTSEDGEREAGDERGGSVPRGEQDKETR